MFSSFFFNDTTTTEIYTLSLHDALPIFGPHFEEIDFLGLAWRSGHARDGGARAPEEAIDQTGFSHVRSEEHTSELQSQSNLVCRLLLEKKKKQALAPIAASSLVPLNYVA